MKTFPALGEGAPSLTSIEKVWSVYDELAGEVMFSFTTVMGLIVKFVGAIVK
jgi:hypothetical protein